MKIYIKSDLYSEVNYDIWTLIDVQSELADYNIHFTKNINDADWYVASRFDMRDCCNQHNNIWFASYQDESIVAYGRDIISHPNVKVYEMRCLADTIDKHNIGFLRYHEQFLPKPKEEYKIDTSIPYHHDLDVYQKFRYGGVRQITLKDWSKIRLGLNFYHYRQIRRWSNRHVDCDKERKITTFFRGQYNICNLSQTITEHRQHFANIINQRCNIDCSNNYIPQAAYDQLLLQTKVIVSPWGIGECCFRDAEAMYAGCILIKPYSDYINTYPIGMFTDGVTYIACKPDGSDLLEKIDYALDNWDNFYEMRCNNRKMLMDLWDRNKQAEILRKTFDA